MTAPLRGVAAEQFSELTGTQITHLRLRAQTDLYFLAKGVLGYNQLEERAHMPLCAFMTQEQRKLRMVLVFRGFLKSTICLITDSIRLALCDPENTRILLANEVYDNAAAFLSELKAHWTNGGLLPALFPELVPPRQFGPGSDWAMDSASVNRSSVYKESTWTAIGVGGAAQSKHFSHIKCDDLVGESAKESVTVMERIIRWTDTLTGLLDRLDGPIDYYGTRKTIEDLYSHLMRLYGDRLAVFLREPLENGETIFSKMPTGALLDIMRDKPEVWAHDYMNNPVGRGGLDWGTGFLRYYEINDKREVKLQDTITGALKTWKFEELDVVITVDPNAGRILSPDKAAVVTSAVTPDDEVIVLKTWSGRPSPDGLIDQVWADCRTFSPRVVGFEEAAQQNTIYYFEKKMQAEGMYYRVQPLRHKNKTKEERIRAALDTPLKTRKLYVLPTQFDLISAIQFFPQLQKHMWDEIDALSYGPELYQSGRRLSDLEDERDAERKFALIGGVTGYGDSCIRSEQPGFDEDIPPLPPLFIVN